MMRRPKCESIRHRRCLCMTILVVVAFSSDAMAQFTANVNAWVRQDALAPPPENGLLVIGSSSVRLWARLAQDFADYDIIQRGFGGSQFSDVLRFADDIVLPYNPAGIVIFEGSNDVASGKSADTVFNDYLGFVDRVRGSQDTAADPIPIFFIGITPTPARWSCCETTMSEVNARIRQHAESAPALVYVDTPSRFHATSVSPTEPPSRSLFLSDGLHLNQSGYDIWTEELRSVLESALPPARTYTPNPKHPNVGSRILFDFGTDAPSRSEATLGTDANGNVWNNWDLEERTSSVLAGQRIGNLATTTGEETGVDLVITGEFATGSAGGLLDPNSEALGDLAIESATRDYFWIANDFTPGSFMLTGLNVESRYDFRFLGTRDRRLTQETEFSVFGENQESTVLQTSGQDIGLDGAYDGNDSQIASVMGIEPDEFGQIFIDVSAHTGTFAYLNAMEVTVVAVPEPSSWWLIMFGVWSLQRPADRCRKENSREIWTDNDVHGLRHGARPSERA